MRILNGSEKDGADLLLDNDRQRLRPVFEALSVWASEGADRPADFWERQRTQILSRVLALESRAVPHVPRQAWAIATAVLVIAGFMLNSGPRVKPAPQTPIDPDRELLVEIEQAMQTGGPTALEPAALLAREIGEYENTSSGLPNHQEVGHEE